MISRLCETLEFILWFFRRLLQTWTFLLLIFLSITWGHALTLSGIRTDIRRAVDDNPSDSSFRRYSDTLLLNLINEAQRDVQRNIGDLADKTTVYILAPRTTYYDLPTDVIHIKQVYFTDKSNQLTELDELSQKSLYDKNPAWDRTPGQPNSYWVSQATQPQNQASAVSRISYIPIPTHLSTGAVTIWYSYIMPDLSADSDVPFDNRRNLYSYHDALVYYVTVRIKVFENKATEAAAYQQFYANVLNAMKGSLGMSPNYTPGIAIPGVNR